MSAIVNVSKEDYETKIKPKHDELRRTMAELYEACYDVDRNFAWILNPDFIKLQRQLDYLQNALERVAHYDSTAYTSKRDKIPPPLDGRDEQGS